MWMIAGLGNPGTKYAFNRHNIGFIAVDLLKENLGNGAWKNQDKAQVCKIEWNNKDCLLVKPQNFMNRSGEVIVPLLNYYKISPENLCVIQDEIDFGFGQIKLQTNRGHGGHNGIRNISEQLGHSNYVRLKIGVGRPTNEKMDVSDWVLQNFSNEEMSTLPQLLNLSLQAVESLIHDGYSKAATRFNGASALNSLIK